MYHYTSADGLLGVIGNRQIWATESNFLNDSAEIQFATGLLLERLRAPEAGPTDESSALLEKVAAWLTNSYWNPHAVDQIREDRTYVTSFSRDSEQLTLWRNYAGRNGFCVGFDPDQLLTWMNRDEFPIAQDDEQVSIPEREEREGLRTNYQLQAWIAEVEYGEEASRRTVDQLVSSIQNISSNEFEHDPTLRDQLKQLAAIKHAAFADEREIRLLVRELGHHSLTPNIRVSASHGLVSYHHLEFPHEAVRSITISPGANTEQSKSALRTLLRDGGRGAWEHVEIRVCDIPFVW